MLTTAPPRMTSQTHILFREIDHLLSRAEQENSPQDQDDDTEPELEPGFSTSKPKRMVGKKGSRSQARAEGLQKTDNNMDVTSWPVAGMINQKNYYTEYLKRDDQYLAYRTTQEENTNRMVKEARDRDRALAQSNGIPLADPSNAIDEDTHMEGMETAGSLQEPHGSKVIVIHPGSQNLRIALANAALPKTVPMVVARKWRHNESEENGGEPKPKRVKIDNEVSAKPEEWFGEDFATKYNTESSNLKIRMKNNKRKLMPNSKELVVNFNKRTQPDVISEHNDPQRIDWTEILPGKVPEYFTGHAALRIPDQSRPRYKLFWPLRNGLFNEHDYSQSNLLLNDFFLVIEEAIKSELGLKKKKEWQDYSCCFIIPDLYERKYVTSILDGLMRDFGFKRICFMQESMAASFGAGYSMACVVDIGAQKTSLCCVEDGMCIEDSRMNLKYGGADVTEAFIKMMLFDHFPYEEINLKRRYDLLLADELKHKFCTMNEVDVAVQLYDFHLRASGQDTRKYTFKTYDEPMLAPMGYFIPTLFDHSNKLFGRHKVIDRSYDLYDGSPNDPIPVAQAAVLQYSAQNAPSVANTAPDASPAVFAASTPSKPKPYSLLNRLPQDDTESTPLSSVAGSPVPEGTPQPGRDSPAPGMAEHTNGHISDPSAGRIRAAEERDSILPIMPLDTAIMLCIKEATRGDERKMKDFFGGIMLVGGGAKVAGFNTFLETRLRERMPNYNKEIMIGLPPRELDQQLVAWKGGSVFARLSSSGNDSWIYRREYDMLGAKLLAQKLMWAF